MGSLAPSIKSMNPTGQSADISVQSYAGLSGRAYSSSVMCAKIDLSSCKVAWGDGGGGGYASLKIIDFPEGKINILGATANFTNITLGAGLGASSTSFVLSAGTSPEATGTTLDGAMVNVIPSTAVSITASVGTSFASSTAALTTSVTDGHTTPIDLYLNFAADATDSTASKTAAEAGLTLTGTVYVWYINMGD